VTSLKWIGPEPEESETPKIPHDIKYCDSVPRIKEIESYRGGTLHEEPSKDNSLNSTQARQDAIAKEKLQKMVPVRNWKNR
jgi:hypothetical protein